MGVRPTPDRVKLAVFNSLGERVQQARVLDLFSGTGALGLEALSRGADLVVSVELSAKHARYYRMNVESGGFDAGRIQLRVQDVFAAIRGLLESGGLFDLILADPPYGPKNAGRRSTSLAQRLLDDPGLPRLLEPGGLFVLGHTRRDALEVVPPWELRRELRHGDTVMAMLAGRVS